MGPVLIFQELKGRAAELGGDIEKLRSIIKSYSLEELKHLLGRRIPHSSILDDLEYVIPSVGFYSPDMAIPGDFLQFHVNEKSIEVIVGNVIPIPIRKLLIKALGQGLPHT